MDQRSKTKKKEKSVKFLLAPRPQRDPLAADYEAPQHVLVPKGGLDVDKVREKLPDFDPTLFVSKDETKTGMLERAHQADGMTFDSDVLKAMSKDFDFEDPNNILDDDFIDQAGGLIEDEGEMLNDDMTDLAKDLFEDEPELVEFESDDNDAECSAKESGAYDSDEYDLDGEMRGHVSKDLQQHIENMTGQGRRLILFKKQSTIRGIDSGCTRVDHQSRDDNKSVFTNYSMTSSVMHRSQGLQQIDEHFERLFEKEYADDTEIGALDLNDVKGEELLTNLDQIKKMRNEVKVVREKNHGEIYEPEIVSEHHKGAIIGDEPAAEDDDLVEVEFNRRQNRVDCESILSYNSNLYNHPKLIVEQRRRAASQATNKMEVDDDLDQRSRSEVSRSIASTRATVLSKLSIRPKDETPEDRRARKRALKAYRNERRKERKQNQQIFKAEKMSIVRQQRNNVPALRLA